MLPGPSIFASLSFAFWLNLAKFRPAAENASIKSPRLPPERDRGEAITLRRIGMDKAFGGFDQLIQASRADHALPGRNGVEGFDRAGQRAGMRHGSGASAFGCTELERDHRFAGRAGGLAG
jgi:hypothetical protein